MPDQIKRTVHEWESKSILSSINSKLGIMLVIIVLGIISNITRTTMDAIGDHRQKRIEYLDKRVAQLENQLEACNSGTPMPEIKD